MKLRIDRIDVHLRNVPAATAQDAADLIGPALARAVASAAPEQEHDAGRLAFGTTPSAQTLASTIAQRLAAKTGKG